MGPRLLLLLIVFLNAEAKAPKCDKKSVGKTYEEGCFIYTCTKKGKKFKWKPAFNPLNCCKEKGQMLAVGEVLSEELLDPNCSGECQMKKNWCVQEKCSGDPSKVETWVVTTTIEAGVGSCPAVVKQLCQANQATCSLPLSADGCDQGTECIDKVGNCPLTCPLHCPADHMACPGRSLTLGGETCASEGVCVALPDPNVTQSCPAVCPMTCMPGELSCPLGVDSNGCDLGTQCIKQDPRCPHAACPVHCAPGDVRCAGGIGEDGCPMPDTCMPSTGVCPARCPIVCNSEEKHCPLGADSTTGCDLGGICVPSTTKNPLAADWYAAATCETPCPVVCGPDQLTCNNVPMDGCNAGWYCMDKSSDEMCPQFCPTVCDPLTSITCSGGLDAQGCPKPDICIEKPNPSLAASSSCEESPVSECAPICPVVCGEHEMFCPSAQTHSGCNMVSGTCLPLQVPGTNCSSVCPVPCPPGGFMTCPLPPSPDGCDMGHVCLPETLGDCPNHCPIICPEDHIECPSQSTDSNERCPGPPTCLPTTGACPAQCPIKCGAEEYIHNLGFDEFGCSRGDVCVKLSDEAALCPILPPVMCSNDSIICPGSYSDDGCYSGDWCHPKGSCPSPTCPVTCRADEMPCSSPQVHPDCPATTFCIPITVPSATDPTTDCANVCPSASLECADGLVCPGVASADGCPVASFCQHPTVTSNGTCPMHCPAQCNLDTEMICSTSSGMEGCPPMEFCQPMYTNHSDGHQCFFHCPITCPKGAITCPGGVSSDGCPMADTCSSVPDTSDPLTPACPAVCPVPPCEDAAACHLGFDQNGCDLGHYCLHRTPDCSDIPTCPAICSEEEILCTIPSHEPGCSSSSQYCTAATIPHPSGTAGATCPAHCPPVCNSGEVLQSLGEDSDGCPLGDVCVPEALAACPPCPDMEYFYEGSSYLLPSAECPRRPGEPCTCATHQPPVAWNETSNAGVALALSTNFTCTPTCPCPGGDMPCPTGMDWITVPGSDSMIGCPRPDQCLKPSSKCPVFCPVHCEPPMVTCHLGFGDDGCQLAPVCHEPAACQALQNSF